jgi:hypothetical protein
MATKTIVCPECQAPAAPGRYACAECGALLASVALTPRPYGGAQRETAVDVAPAEAQAEVATRPEVSLVPAVAERSATDMLVTDRPRRKPTAPAWTEGLAAEPIESAPGADERWDDQPPTVGAVAATTVGAVAATTMNRANGGTGPKQAPEKKTPPVAAIKPAPMPKVRRRTTPDPEALERIAPLAVPQPEAESAPVAALDPAVPAAPEPATKAATEPAPLAASPAPAPTAAAAVERTPNHVPTAPFEPAPTVKASPRFQLPTRPEPAPRVEPAPQRETVPAWPPPGDRGPLVEPLPRVPAGVYLPPSAVLPPGEALPVGGSTNGRTASSPSAAAIASSDGTSERISAADRLAQLGLPPDTPRRVVAIGAVVAALGFLLPWSTSPTGNDLIGDYWVRWGLAGPGAWIVVALLIGLAALTLAGGRFADAAVGLPGVALAMLLLGLSWSYLFGYPGGTVGIWVVLAGAILLAVGGLLDMRADRHGDSQPTV